MPLSRALSRLFLLSTTLTSTLYCRSSIHIITNNFVLAIPIYRRDMLLLLLYAMYIIINQTDLSALSSLGASIQCSRLSISSKPVNYPVNSLVSLTDHPVFRFSIRLSTSSLTLTIDFSHRTDKFLTCRHRVKAYLQKLKGVLI